MTAMVAPGGGGMSSRPGKSMSQQGDKIPKGYVKGQLQQFTPEQMQLFQSMFGQTGPDSFLGKLAGGDEQMFQQMEEPAMRQFGQLQGNIASRFSGMGMGGRKSSGFQNTMGQASSDFASQLQGQRQQLQRQALMDMMGISSNLLGQRPQEKFVGEKPKSFLEQLLLSLASNSGDMAKAFAGGA